MWEVIEFSTVEAMQAWIAENEDIIEYEEVFINNSYGLEYRFLRKML